MTNRELRAVPAMRAVAVVVAGLFAGELAAQQEAAEATPTEKLVKWYQSRRADDQFQAFAEYRRSLPAKHKRPWIGDLDNAMRDFGRSDASTPPAAAVTKMVADLQKVHAAGEPLHPYAPWLLLAVGAHADDLRLRWLVIEAMAEPGTTLDIECARECAAVVCAALEDDAKGAVVMRREELLGWLPELDGCADSAARLAFLRPVVEGLVERLQGDGGIETGALRRARLMQLDAQFLAEARQEKGDPFAVIERMRELAPDDVTNDLVYLLLAGSEGRKGDKDLEKAARKRLDEAWKAREKSGLDVESMKRRLAAAGVLQVCGDLGLPLEVASVLRLSKDDRVLAFPSAAGAEQLCRKATTELNLRVNAENSAQSSIDTAKEGIASVDRDIDEARRKLSAESNASRRAQWSQRIKDLAPKKETYQRNLERGQRDLERLKKQAEEARIELDRRETRRAHLFD